MNTNENLQIVLRQTTPADLEDLFLHQADDEAAYMAAFVNEKFKDKEAYIAKWNKLLQDDTLQIRTILLDDKIIGSLSTWMLHDERQVSYGIGKEYWGRGIVTHALKQFLAIVPDRPLYGRIAFDNTGSGRVLEKCGFKRIGEDKFYAFARKEEIVEFIYLLEA